MKFRNKILFSILGVVFVVIVVTYFVITSLTRSRIVETFSEELKSNYLTVSVFNQLRIEDAIKSCLVISESPRLKAVTEIGDSTTAHQLIVELYQGVPNEIYLLTDAMGKPLVELYRGGSIRGELAYHTSIQTALEYTSTGYVIQFNDELFRMATAPILVGADIVGTLSIGSRITEDEIFQLRKMTNSEIAIIASDKTLYTTLPAFDHTGSIDAAVSNPEQQILTFTHNGSSYLGILYDLNESENHDDTAYYFLMKSIEKELAAMITPVRRAFILIALLVFSGTALLGSVIARSISKPIEKLVEGTKEISKGKFGYLSNISSKDELGFLSKKFDEMSISLKEKVDELAKLNIDLKRQNEELEKAFKKLRATQEELVKSERLAATGKLTAQLSHEINNPIHNIQSCLETALQRTDMHTKNRDLIEVAYEEVSRMSKLIRQMLDIHRLSMVEEKMVCVNINEVVRQTVKISKELIDKNNIDLQITLSSKELPVLCAPEKLKQVFFNILLNAKDAMENGGILSVKTFPSDGNGCISFSDTGTGIPTEHLNKIFDAFFTTKSDVRGVGLGLSVSYGIIKQHNGRIDVHSKVGKGSTFIISIPLHHPSGDVHNENA